MATLKVEVADTPLTLAKGLMGRKALPKGTGMLFKFPMVLEASFWGKNTYIPLDVAFIDSDHKIVDIQPIVPLSTKAIRSKSACSMAIEANAGFFKANGINIGDNVSVVQHDDDITEITFNA